MQRQRGASRDQRGEMGWLPKLEELTRVQVSVGWLIVQVKITALTRRHMFVFSSSAPQASARGPFHMTLDLLGVPA